MPRLPILVTPWQAKDAIDVVRIHSTLNQAIQPLSIARNSDHKALTRRLYNRVTSTPEAFTAAGFEFLLDRPSPTSATPEAEDAARVD